MSYQLTVCPTAYLILILIIVSNILDSYLVIRYNFHKNNNVILGLSLIITVAISVLLIWIANNTCNKYVWVSWIIILLLIINIYDSIMLFVDPKKREKVLSEINEYDNVIRVNSQVRKSL